MVLLTVNCGFVFQILDHHCRWSKGACPWHPEVTVNRFSWCSPASAKGLPSRGQIPRGWWSRASPEIGTFATHKPCGRAGLWRPWFLHVQTKKRNSSPSLLSKYIKTKQDSHGVVFDTLSWRAESSAFKGSRQAPATEEAKTTCRTASTGNEETDSARKRSKEGSQRWKEEAAKDKDNW